MNPLLIIAAAALTLIALFICHFLLMRRADKHLQIVREEMVRKTSEAQFLQQNLQDAQERAATHESREEGLQQQLAAAKQAEKLALQQVEHAGEYKRQWEQHRLEFEQHARASVMAAGQELSSKLLTDHKREAEEVKTKFAQQQEVQQQKFAVQFQALTESVAAVRQVSLESKKQGEILWRTMSAPHSVGQLTEVALENLLKNLGLRKDVDFKLQASVLGGEGAGLRPDCVIYLPHDRLMIIDCKASKHQLELESAEGETAQAEAREKFRNAMHKHLDMLARKAYSTAVTDEFRQRTGRQPHHQIINVMYIASEAAVEKLDSLDPSFRDKMQKAGIIPVGPSGLQGLCSIAGMHISEAQKSENQERILHEIERLLAGFATALGHLEKLGNSLKSAASHFASFTGSYNRTVAPKLRHLGTLGVKPEGKTALPERMPVFELRNVEDWLVIEGEEQQAASAEILSLSDKEGVA